jgi:hypothetical protein
MWVMTSFGILMPSAIPASVSVKDPSWTLQVRARDRQTLTTALEWMNTYELGHSKIIATPDLDYEYRFYCSHGSFAELMDVLVGQIDYEKFKPTTELMPQTRHLHDLYNEIWGVVFTHYSRRRNVRRVTTKKR